MAARRTDGQREVLLSTKAGMIIRFPEEEVRPMGRTAGASVASTCDDDDQVIAAEVVQEGVSVFTITERGFGKRTPLEEYRLQGRGGKGIIDIKTEGRNGSVVGMLQIRETDDILAVTTKGQMIRVHGGDITSQGRNTMGVRIIALDADDRVGSVARVEAEQVVEPPAEPRAEPPPSRRHSGTPRGAYQAACGRPLCFRESGRNQGEEPCWTSG